MVTILTPLSLPTDIQQQTIYTVVSKPVRRLEMIWGRMIGYMALVTVLVLVFGGISLLYLKRTVGGTTMDQTIAAAKKAQKEDRLAEAKLLSRAGRPALHADDGPGADQGVARVPRLAGDAARDGHRRRPGRSSREPRSHIEGATPSAAIWSFGGVPDPFTPPGRAPGSSTGGSRWTTSSPRARSSGISTASTSSSARIDAAQEDKQQPQPAGPAVSQLDQAIARNQQELERAARSTRPRSGNPTSWRRG